MVQTSLHIVQAGPSLCCLLRPCMDPGEFIGVKGRVIARLLGFSVWFDFLMLINTKATFMGDLAHLR